MIVVKVREDHGIDVARRVEAAGEQARAHFLMRSDADLHLPEKGMPAWQISRDRIAPCVARINQEAPFGVFDQEAQDRHWLHPVAVAEDVDLAPDGAAIVAANALRGLHPGFAGFDRRDADHRRPHKER
jgi:hypothetical protein